ncbi:MAG: hypothetical protein C0624_08160 [Desulfuromonas sp.]|nr:MAG: hypothetical protein C0624_08160 [Desulfuromonas sp.]
MEQALFLSRPTELAGDYSRLHYGAEFCPWNLSSVADILTMRAACRDHGWRFSLVTPVVDQSAYAHLQDLLKQLLPELDADDEVVVNDLGCIELVRGLRPELSLVIGRALSGQKRGPQILDLELNDEQRDYFRQGTWYSDANRALLTELGIERVELDNLLQGVSPLPEGFTGVLHTPYAMVTSSGTCPFRPHADKGPCPAPCGEVMVLTTPESQLPLYQGGNTQFIRLDNLPENLAELGIERVVHHPVLPR